MTPAAPDEPSLTLQPIGYVRSPFDERAAAPRQPVGAPDALGCIELLSGHNYEDALADLGGFSHVWVLFWFDRCEGWRPKVHPPRSATKRGVFSTRSPYRPNPLGLSLVQLEALEGLTLRVRGLDLLEGTPVLDLKPYLPHADAPRPALGGELSAGPAGVRSGWLGAGVAAHDPQYTVEWSAKAREQLTFLCARAVDLERVLTDILKLGPAPHAYRRIRREGDGYRLAYKEWRARFRVEEGAGERRITVQALGTGYRPRELMTTPELDVHRAFVERFGYPGT